MADVVDLAASSDDDDENSGEVTVVDLSGRTSQAAASSSAPVVIDIADSQPPGEAPTAASGPARKRRRTNGSGGTDATQVNMHNSAVIGKKDLVCPVCMDSIARPVTVTKCGHMFCKGCIVSCIKAHHRCPICNKKLTQRDHHPLFI